MIQKAVTLVKKKTSLFKFSVYCVIYLIIALFSGLVKGFIAEKQVSEECIHTLENRTELLIQENEKLRSRLQVLEDGQEEVFHREQELEHQREALKQSADNVQLGIVTTVLCV